MVGRRAFVRSLAVCILLAGALVSLSCDTTQPARATGQVFTLGFRGQPGFGAVVVLDVFRLIRDDDNDGQPDAGTEPSLFCQRRFNTNFFPRSAPIAYGLQIQRIRAGEIEPELLTLEESFDQSANLSSYEDAARVMGSAQNPITMITSTTDRYPITASGTNPDGSPDFPGLGTDRYKLTYMFTTSATDREVVQATSNPVSTQFPTVAKFGQGRCSLSDPGPPITDGVTADVDDRALPFSIDVDPGDTIIIEAIAGATALMTGPPDNFPVNPTAGSPIDLIIDVTLNGNPVENIDNITEGGAGSALRFSFTVL